MILQEQFWAELTAESMTMMAKEVVWKRYESYWVNTHVIFLRDYKVLFIYLSFSLVAEFKVIQSLCRHLAQTILL